MKPFRNYTGSVVPLPKSNIDTDIIIPTEFLKRVERAGYGQHLMYYWRFDEHGGPRKDFVLNNKTYEQASILLSGDNFGCGSSRENAVWALHDYGFQVIIAPSFADIFKGNCSKNGLLLIELDQGQMQELFELEKQNPNFSMHVDLENQIIHAVSGWAASFQVAPHIRHKFLNGLDDIDLTMTAIENISAFERQRAFYMNPCVN
ncbi:3-isopropylmalate dehydratase small subunit [Virgibacillus phasianinus]|uniref:3-isopropylmalate dehydratase small subunit n=1 Tax=Virgibacillus phasianinus TaxID=2017483 RepID=A0A220U2W2_9BACI|nr:3-isopropylmalate dehydratase small subunit [Virgibacillus phasianinus]ASK62498.1 3-isopropylmalate dehydratase small subunit [Virgibacillus phasianinus]